MKRRYHRLSLRFRTLRLIRDFFQHEGYTEADTALLVPTPGMEETLRFIDVKGEEVPPLSLISSPEFGMKKIMAEGFEKIFYLGKSFRDEPLLPFHSSEFTLLEWYTARQNRQELYAFLKKFLVTIAQKVNGSSVIEVQGHAIDLAAEWEVFSLPELFREKLGIPLTPGYSYNALKEDALRFGLTATAEDSWDDIFYKLFLNELEGQLSQRKVAIVYDYPPSQAALAEITKEGWADRFELYIGGVELANAFNELRDPVEQRHRFETSLMYRKSHQLPCYPVDEELLEAIGNLPQTMGIAFGVDRFLMLLTGSGHISEVLSL